MHFIVYNNVVDSKGTWMKSHTIDNVPTFCRICLIKQINKLLRIFARSNQINSPVNMGFVNEYYLRLLYVQCTYYLTEV